MKIKLEVKSSLSVLLTLLLMVGITITSTSLLVQPAKAIDDSVIFIKELTQLSTGHEEHAPSIVLDHDSNLHAVWVGNNSRNLYYMMVDDHGNILINETCLDPNPNAYSRHAKRPSIDVDSNNTVHIVFHGDYAYDPWPNYTSYINLDAQEVFYLQLNPYLDDMDGSMADYVNITVVPETIISVDDGIKSRAANIAVDSADNLHVAWFDDGRRWSVPFELHYLVMNQTGHANLPEINVTAGFLTDPDWGEPEIVVDSNGNSHVFFVTEAWTNHTRQYRDIYYTMINGTDGTVLINNTQLTDSNRTWRHTRPFVDIDSQDMIHIAWHDSRFYSNETGEHEIFYMKIDPYLDDQNGNSTDLETIKVVDEMQISKNDYWRSYLANIAVDKEDVAHIAWINGPGGEDGGVTEISYARVNSTGEMIIPATSITPLGPLDFAYWSGSSSRNPEIVVANGHIIIVDMAQDSADYEDIWLTIVQFDITPPDIGVPTHLPPANISEGQPVRVLVNITDSEKGVNDDKVILSFSFDNGTFWYNAKMSYNSSLGLYEAVVPPQFNCTWVSYKISATDNAGNTAVQDNNELYYSYHVIPEFPTFIILPLIMLLAFITTALAKIRWKAKIKIT
ncbi:MAG: hypothetical protein JSV51_08295 [Candidatus Bathyarchaeota archaeon]|nr:MAG: hypothetical protein JSV51_08295 [Candidatus Bathyarchaeota archaeon]